MSISALGRLKNHKIPRLHPNFRMCMPLNRHQLKMYAFPVKTQCLFQMRTFTVNQNLSRFYAPLWQFYAPLSRFYATNSDFYSEKTGDDSDFTQNFWVKFWRVGSLCGGTGGSSIPPSSVPRPNACSSVGCPIFHFFFYLSYTLLTTHALGLYEFTKKNSAL